jgi:hypothetical protein
MRPRAERGFRFLRGPFPCLSAKAKHAADGRSHIFKKLLAVLGIVQRAGRRFLQREQIEFGDIVDVYVGPDVLALANVQADAGFLRVVDQRRHLGTLLAQTAAFAIDHGGTYHDGTHALRRRIENGLVDRGPLLHARYGGRKTGVFVVDRVAASTVRHGGDDARSAGMQERFPGAVQRGCDGFHHAGMIRFRRIDYGVGFARRARNDFRVIERTE